MSSRRVVLATGGSLGDIHPMIALGLALQARGLEAAIATSTDYRAKIETAGLGFHAVGPSIERLTADTGLDLPALTRRIAEDNRFLFRDVMMAYAWESVTELLAACSGATAVVGSTFAPGAPPVAEKLDLPLVVVSLQPTTVFSAYDPPFLPKAPWLRPAAGGLPLMLNRATLAAARRVSAPWTRAFNRVRSDFGVSASRHDVFFDALAAADLGLGLYSPLLSRRQPDAPETFRVVGYAPYDSETGAASALSGPLETFLAAGDPPIVFTLGSAAVNIAGDFYAEGLRAARALGRRSVLLVGPEGDTALADAPDAIALAYAPYSQLFSRAAIVVHQGGVGTTQQALRAGRPQIVVPHLGDQYDNAARIARLGCGAVLIRSSYSSGLHGLLGSVLSDAVMERRAASVSEIAGAEDGAARGAELIVTLIADWRRPD